MNAQQLINIVYDRAGRWGRKLIMHNATPFITIGITHGADAGQLILCTTDELTTANIKDLLKAAILELDRR